MNVTLNNFVSIYLTADHRFGPDCEGFARGRRRVHKHRRECEQFVDRHVTR